MRVNKLDTGLEAISRWRESDEVHLPASGQLAPAFMPAQTPLNEILHRLNLDERLVGMMQPQSLDPELLDAAVLSRTRREVRDFFAAAARRNPRLAREMQAAAELLDDEVELDEAVSSALAALLRG
jgi:hypothetical protein